ncbi:hypothetical protein ATCC90586_005049 [Pythium insidiosum]|nr:hypothetical protein ATCC90586_005049 [Pythium insidiosum]
MASSIEPDAAFVYDGKSSDLVQQFYRLHTQGVEAEPLRFPDIPAAVQKRLAASSYKFDELPGLLQRALLWDTGYTRTFKNDGWVEVRTKNGVSMAEIAISLDKFKSAACTPQYCKQPDGKPWDKSLYCTGAQMLTVARCATSALKDEGIDYSMWATGGDPKAIPEVSAIRHKWTDKESNTTYMVNALHTLPERYIPRWNFCVDSSNTAIYGSIVIPCHPMDRMNASLLSTMKTPKTGALVTAWLNEPFATRGAAAVDDSTTTAEVPKKKSDKFNMVLIAPIAVGALLVVFIGVWLVRRRRRRAPADAGGRAINGDEIAGDYNRIDGYSGGGRRPKTHTTTTTNNTTWSVNTTGSSHSGRPSMWEDPTIAAIRIPFDKITFGPLVSRGGFGEVYRGVYKGQDVAIKSLLPERRRDMKQIENFLDEVKLIAGLEHERIVSFIGVAWESLSDLCAVTEFMAGGDLRSMLQNFDHQGRPLGFDHDKIKMALHVVHALTYLHSLQPVVVHRDLKSKNVLLTQDFDAKLTDFGVSRERADNTMTAGVGSSLWMAPEVMLGERYDEKADVFSFGVVLSELDTLKLPYAHAVEPGTGRKLPDTAVLQMVSLGRLSVEFASREDNEMVKIGRACVALKAKDRPTSAEVLHAIHMIWRHTSASF